MAKKLIKDSPIRKNLIGNFISEVPTEAEKRKSVNTESRIAVSTPEKKTNRTVKLTIIIPEEIDIILEDIIRKRRQIEGKKPSKKALIIEAVKLLAEKEGLAK